MAAEPTVGVVLYPDFESLDVYGPVEAFGCLAGLFRITNQSQHGVKEPVLEVKDELSKRRAIAALRFAQKLDVPLLLAGDFRLRGSRQVGLVMCSADARHRLGRRRRGKVPSVGCFRADIRARG